MYEYKTLSNWHSVRPSVVVAELVNRDPAVNFVRDTTESRAAPYAVAALRDIGSKEEAKARLLALAELCLTMADNIGEV